MNIEVEKNIPIPEGRRDSQLKFPYPSMAVGDSFAVPIPSGADAGTAAARIRATSNNWGVTNNAKFLTRLVENKTKVRVWRVA